MPNCWTCGEPIIVRHVDGILKPIHLHGGWCSDAPSGPIAAIPFQTVESYVNPNAYCPVCGEKVYFYQSIHGGRVFFDDLGWPWPKHKCTDNGSPLSKSPSVTRGPISIKDRHGNALEIYNLDDADEFSDRYILTFRNARTRARLNLILSKGSVAGSKVSIEDFWGAPSFLIRRDHKRELAYRVEFISCRRGKILIVRMPSPR